MAQKPRPRPKAAAAPAASLRFESARLNSPFTILDAVAWLDAPDGREAAQFADIDPRTAGKILKNAVQLNLIDVIPGKRYVPLAPYPYKGTLEQKKAVVRESLVGLPLLTSMRQFMKLGDNVENSLRKAATVRGIKPFDAGNFKPLIDWANSLDALATKIDPEDLIDETQTEKAKRHEVSPDSRVAFISHSSKDKLFVRRLASDLVDAGIGVWLDEQHIKVGESIPDQIAQGLASSDYFLFISSENSANSEWVKKELNNALIIEVQRRKVHVLPVKMDASSLPPAIADKKYADFSKEYKEGLTELLEALGR